MSNRTGYSAVQITLHWLIAILIVAALVTHESMETAVKTRVGSGAPSLPDSPLHVWLGGAAFVLILIRVVVRKVSGAPGPIPGSSQLMALAALWGHRLLYLLMLLAPALGALAWFGRLDFAGELHESAGNALFFVALAHAAVALWHHYVKKDGAMTRMMKPGA